MLTDITPVQALAAGALVVALAALVVIFSQRRRLAEGEAERRRLEAVAVKAREMLAAAPDGLFLWDYANGGFTCSRRMAVLLDLEAGVNARYDDVRARFEGDSLKALEQGVSRLRGNGGPFDILLTTGRRTIQAVGARAEADDGEPLADMVWMRDLTGAGAGVKTQQAAVNTSGFDDRHLTALLDAMPLPVWLRDSRLNLAFANRAARDLPAAGPDMAERARKEGKPLSERRRLNGDGAERLVEVTETPLGALGGGHGGATGGTVGFAVDRSDAEAWEDERRDLTNARDAVLESISTAVAIFDSGAELRFFNTAYAKLWDLDPEWLHTGPGLGDVLERLRDQRKLPEVADFREFKLAQLARFETIVDPEDELLHLPDGRTVEARASRQGPGGLVLVFDDVSDRLDLERSYKSLGAVQHETIDNLHEGIAVFGPDGRLKLYNPVFQGLWEMETETLTDAYHVSDFVEHTRALIKVEGGWDDLSWGVHKEKALARMMGRDSTTGQLELITGTVVDYANVPLPDGAMLLSYLDVTDSTRVEQALRSRAEALAEADRLKSEFIANVSYEVRTPLTTIIGFADMLGQQFFGKLNRRQGEYARGILDTSRSLMAVIGDILDLASIEAGRMELDRDTVDVHGLLVSALNLIQERARNKEIKVEFDCPPDIGWINGDEKRLKQVIFHLLSNAVTFTPERGTVRLEARRDEGALVLTIADTGIGIPQADRERVFLPFEQGKGLDVDKGGAGLGLSLVRNFIQLHGGTVEVKSPPGRGTTVVCRLPATGQGSDKADGAGKGGA